MPPDHLAPVRLHCPNRLACGGVVVNVSKSRAILPALSGLALVALCAGAPFQTMAQSPGGSSSRAAVAREMAISNGLEAAARQGMDLTPKTTATECEQGKRLLARGDQR
ncbi:hypothetical protein, partial [Azospirillum sp. B506]|uniref:hypothetical protein n=1 Tax=Azospirillum sp. B506 TaxID=137721 RepID=UPI0011DD4297